MVKDKIEESKMRAKCIAKRNPELCALNRAKMAKVERDQGRATLASLEFHNHSEIERLHEQKKAALLQQHDANE